MPKIIRSPSEDYDDIWRKAVDEVMICNCIGTTDGAKSVQDALDELGRLIQYEVKMATDPKINGGKILVDEAEYMQLKSRDRGLTPPTNLSLSEI